MFYSNAGHNPLVYYSSKNDNCFLEELPGPALGISQKSIYQRKEIILQKNDVLVIYTDGITESINNNSEMFGMERLKEFVAEVKTDCVMYLLGSYSI